MITKRSILLSTAAAAFLAGTLGLPTAALAQDRTIAGIVFQQDQFFQTIQMGMRATATAAGAELLEANSESKPEKEANLIDTYIARGVDAIVISPISADASAPALQRAADAGIKIVTYNSAVNGDFPVSYLNSAQRDLGSTTGALAATFIKDTLGGKAKIATLGFKSLLPEISADRVDSFIEEAGKGGTVGAVQAVREAGLQGKIFVFGIDGTEQLAGFVLDDDNVLQAVTAQQPFVMGSMAVQAALDALDGKPVEKAVIVPVIGLSRTAPEGVTAFLEQLKSLQ